jgi:multiple sugar transport system substrate-binding protein
MNDQMIHLHGITWNHSRGYVSVVATAQRFEELNPGARISWEKRSLQEFADYPLDKLVDRYDFLVIDHPWAGASAKSGILLPLEQHLSAGFMADQAANSVGKSHISYDFDGYHTALAIDAATPVASYRPDILEREGETVPETWDDLLAVARKGLVAHPGIPVDSVMNWYMLCTSQGEPPFVNEEWAVSDDMAVQALDQQRELASLCNDEIFGWNPIRTYEALSNRDDLAYCPFAYGYSNYSREGYSKYLLTFADTVTIGDHGHLSTTLGGTGLAISATTQHRDVALAYAEFTASPLIQRTIFAENSGQPGHRAAWLDETVNARTNNFFTNTLPTLDHAYLRPRYAGSMHFQDNAGAPIRDYLMQGGDVKVVLAQLKKLYEESKAGTE